MSRHQASSGSGTIADAGPPPAAASVTAALKTVIDALRPVGTETVALPESLGRVLATDVPATADLPPWANAAMDGYACREEDIGAAAINAPVRLPVVATIAAGALPERPLRTGESMRIMTGAPVPEGADSVVRVEDTDGGTDTVAIHSSRDARANVRPQGQDVRAGDAAVPAGVRVTPAEIALLAAVGAAEVEVFRGPRVAILSSGDELVPIERAVDARSGRCIVSANNYSLAALVSEAGGEAVDMGVVPDRLDALREALLQATSCDLIVTSGGISVGGFDFTRDAVDSLQGEILFWRVPMRPGYNTAFGRIRGTPWIGVPGNPVSALVAGEVLLKPAVRKLSGARALCPRLQTAIAAERLPSGRGATVFLRGIVELGPDGLPLVRLAGPQGSAILSSSVRADALLVIPPGNPLEAGEKVGIILLRGESSLLPAWDERFPAG